MHVWKTRIQHWILSDRQNWRQASRLVKWLWVIGSVLFLPILLVPRFPDVTFGAAWQMALMLTGLSLCLLGGQLNTGHLIFSRSDRIFRWAGFGLLGLMLGFGLYPLLIAYGLP